MKYEFAVAHAYHMSGGRVEDIDDMRFPNYKEAKEYAKTFLEYCEPTIYIIIDDKYVFYCHYSEVFDDVPWVYSIQSTPWGQIETRIWWKKLNENPQAFYHLAQGKLGNNTPIPGKIFFEKVLTNIKLYGIIRVQIKEVSKWNILD